MTTNLQHEIEPAGELAARLELFRSAMDHIAERGAARPVNIDWLAPARRRHRSAQRRMALAWTCTAALCLAVLPVSMQKANRPQPQAAPTVRMAANSPGNDDTALLDQVDTAIAEPVPASLAPLTEMDNWNTDASTRTSPQSTETK